MNKIESTDRTHLLDSALRVEYLSLSWVVTETILSAFAAVAVGSLAISAFSVDSGVELLSGFVLLGRLFMERRTGRDAQSKRVERISAAIVGLCLFTLAIFISLKSGQALHRHASAPMSQLGLMVALGSSVITPWLAFQKRRLGERLHSHALMGDAACSMTCAYMAWTLLGGLLLQKLFGFWWIDPVAAVGILYFVLREAWESLIGAWTGEEHIHAH